MKVLKIIGIVVAVIIAVVIVLALIAPDEFQAERTITIDAPKELVFNNVKYWSKWDDWSPWADMDTSMVVTITGDDGTVGAKYSWVGDPELTGSGEMTATGITPHEEITYHMHFVEPYESEAEGYVRVSDVDGNQTRVAWGFYGETEFPFSIMLIFTSMESMMAEDFDRGLGMLKEMSEKQAEAVAKYEVQEVEWPGRTFAAIRRTVKMDEMQEFYAESYRTIDNARKEAGARLTGMPCGLYYTWDEAGGRTEMAAAMPVSRPVSEGVVETIEIGERTAYTVDHYGHYEKLGDAHMAIDLYMAQNGIEAASPVVEEYMTDPQAEPDPGKWLTKIYYFAK